MAGTAASYKDAGGATRNRSVTTAATLDIARTIAVDETDAPVPQATSTLQTAANTKLDTMIADLAAILAKIIAGPATEVTSAAILAKLSSATSLSDAARLPVSQQDGLAVSGTATSAAVLFTQDMVGYESISVQCTSPGSGSVVTYETSDDNTNWLSCVGFGSTFNQNNAPSSTSVAAGLLVFPRYGRYFRARVSTYGSGTISVVGNVSKVPRSLYASGQVVASSQGMAAHGAAITNNPVRGGARARDFGTPYATLSADQVADLVSNLVGHLKVTREHLASHISTATTTTIKSGKGLLSKIVIGTGAAGTATIYDNTTGTGTVIGVIDCAAQRTIMLDVTFATGLTIVTTGTADITVAYL
ncbi:hypothetical protein NKJ87_20070 [Mesorhizobium sp. M0027]|uniref:hypothetical protein n=1 Tax=Mesorhizobium sp. M0027 TaxID=2956848 RepID=UPI00333652B4